MIDLIDSPKHPLTRALWPALALGVALSNVAPLWTIAPLTQLFTVTFACVYGRSNVVDTVLLCPRWHALVVLPAATVVSLWLQLDHTGALQTSLMTITVLTTIGALCVALSLADSRDGVPPEMWALAAGFVAAAAALLSAVAFVTMRTAPLLFALAAGVVGAAVGAGLRLRTWLNVVALLIATMVHVGLPNPPAALPMLVIVLLLWCGLHGGVAGAQRRPVWFALGAVAAIVYAGRASFTKQSHVSVLNTIEQMQGANATFDAELRRYVRANEAEVRAALDTAARWRSHFTFATSMRSPASSGVESLLRRVPALWRFVAIGLLGAFDGVPDADRRAASLQRQFFGDAQTTAINTGPLRDECRTNDRRTAAEPRVQLRTQTLFLNESSHSATLEIYEVYENVGKCWNDEIRYSFRVPPGAQVTNLFLGTSSDRAARTPSTVEPSSLAERIYAEETRMQRDPALLELTAPQTYRLRVAPIAKRPETHVWIEIALLGTTDDVWTLPTMLERRHLFWNQATSRRACMRPLDSVANSNGGSNAGAGGAAAGDKRANDRIAAAWRSVQQIARAAEASVDDPCDAALIDRQQLEIGGDEAAQHGALIGALDQWFGGKRTIPRSAQSQRAGREPVSVTLPALVNSTVHGTVHVLPRVGAPLDTLRTRRVAIAIDRSAAMRAHSGKVRRLLDEAAKAGVQADVLLLASPSRTEAPLVVSLADAVSSEGAGAALNDTFGVHELHDSIQQSDWIASIVGTHFDALLLVTESGAASDSSATPSPAPLFKNDSTRAWNAAASSAPLLLHFVDAQKPLELRQSALQRVHATTGTDDARAILAQLGAIASQRDAFGNVELRLADEPLDNLQIAADSLKAVAGAHVLHLQRLQIDSMEQFRVAESIGVVTRLASRIALPDEWQRERLQKERTVAVDQYVAEWQSNQPLALFESSSGSRLVPSGAIGLALFIAISWLAHGS